METIEPLRQEIRAWAQDGRARDHQSLAVTKDSPPDAKIKLFRSLFRGREDVYPRRFENRKTGKAGYAPAWAWVVGRPDDQFEAAAITVAERWHGVVEMERFHAEPRANLLPVRFRSSRIRLVSARTNCVVNKQETAKSQLRFIHQQLSAGTSKPVAQVKSHA